MVENLFFLCGVLVVCAYCCKFLLQFIYIYTAFGQSFHSAFRFCKAFADLFVCVLHRMFLACVKDFLNREARSEKTYFEPHLFRRVHLQRNIDKAICRHKSINIFTCNDNICNMLIERSRFPFCLFEIINLMNRHSQHVA